VFLRDFVSLWFKKLNRINAVQECDPEFRLRLVGAGAKEDDSSTEAGNIKFTIVVNEQLAHN
jgi:hypothetical protein